MSPLSRPLGGAERGMNRVGLSLVSAPMMKCLLVTAAMLGASLSAQDARPSASLERPFVSNGLVKMALSAGDYRIVGGTQDHVRLDWSIRDAEALAKVRARADVRDHEAKITTDGPGNKGLRFTI